MMMRRAQAVSLVLAVVVCGVAAAMFLYAFARPRGSTEAIGNTTPLQLMEDRLARVEEATAQVARSLTNVLAELDRLTSIVRRMDRQPVSQEELSPKPAEAQSTASVEDALLPVPWKMVFAGGSPQHFDIDDLLSSLGLSRAEIDDDTVRELAVVLEDYKQARKEARELASLAVDQAADQLEQEGRFFSRSEFAEYEKRSRELSGRGRLRRFIEEVGRIERASSFSMMSIRK